MPAVSVPLKDAPGWDDLMRKRRTFWATGTNNKLSPHFKAEEFYTHDGSACPINARPAMVKLCKTYLEPMRAKFGMAVVFRGTGMSGTTRRSAEPATANTCTRPRSNRWRPTCASLEAAQRSGPRKLNGCGRKPEGRAASAATTAPASSTSTTAATRLTGRASREET